MFNPIIDNQLFLPYRVGFESNSDTPTFYQIIDENPDVILLDFFASQKKEMFKIQNPTVRLKEDDLQKMYEDWVMDKNPEHEGAWFYYPWSKRLLHILDKDEFIKLRTSRNHYKITPEEQNELSKKTIGIIGLSVGHAVALNIATERICGKLKLADFDTIELSNLNRLKTGLHNIGLNKCVMTAREIAELDPYIEVECYTNGITPDNLKNFLTEGENLSILIDECDDIETKISCRMMAKELKIPVIMETSDRGMLDVERFDSEPERPILHGMLQGIPPEKLLNISPQDRIPLTMKIVDVAKGSTRGKVSLLEIGQTITTWPQLASAVSLGGGVVTDVCRRLLLHQFTESGRYYVDLEQIICDQNSLKIPEKELSSEPKFNVNQAIKIVDQLQYNKVDKTLPVSKIEQLVEAGTLAPSHGNSQPWKWVYRNGRLHLFHDRQRSVSFSNPDNMAALLALGASVQNINIKGKQLGLLSEVELLPLGDDSELIASIYLKESDAIASQMNDLADFIYKRSTNRNMSNFVNLSSLEYSSLSSLIEKDSEVNLRLVTTKNEINSISAISAQADLLIMLNSSGHDEHFQKNTRWSPDEFAKTNDGIPAQNLNNSSQFLAALSILRDPKVSSDLQKIEGGKVISQTLQWAVGQASAIGIFSVDAPTPINYIRAGMAVQNFWLQAERLGFSLQPLFAPISLFKKRESKNELTPLEIEKVNKLFDEFKLVSQLTDSQTTAFLLKLTKADQVSLRTKRLPLNEILFMVNEVKNESEDQSL